VPAAFAAAIAEIRADSFLGEQETLVSGVSGNRSIGILRGNISEQASGTGDTVWIVRDITEQKRVACEREAARKSLALAEIAASGAAGAVGDGKQCMAASHPALHADAANGIGPVGERDGAVSAAVGAATRPSNQGRESHRKDLDERRQQPVETSISDFR